VEADRDLIEKINGGDIDAFETLYCRHRDWVYRLAWRFTGQHQDALDVLQETFIYLLKKFPGFELTASMTTFLYPVVKHLALNRRRGPSVQYGDTDILTTIPAPSHEESSRAELAAALRGLPIDQREVVLMRFLDGFSLDEIAAALNIPSGTVKSRLHNALKVLRTDPQTRDYFLG
jgi:RNA polymerase sigma-70 factor, ECF subfamily